MAAMWKRISAWLGIGPAPRTKPRVAAPAGVSGVRASGVAAPSAGAARIAARPGPPPGRHLAYAPKLDGQADPGEIVWTWVPFEEDASQGKDRPVLIVGREGSSLLGLMLSSQHDREGQHNWFALGTGDWDSERRPSFLRLDRVLDVHEDEVRREGAILDRKRFDAVAGKLRSDYGWH